MLLAFSSTAFCCADCPGTASEEAGKASACQGCPNQAVCASAPKGPDPGVLVKLLEVVVSCAWGCVLCTRRHCLLPSRVYVL